MPSCALEPRDSRIPFPKIVLSSLLVLFLCRCSNPIVPEDIQIDVHTTNVRFDPATSALTADIQFVLENRSSVTVVFFDPICGLVLEQWNDGDWAPTGTPLDVCGQKGPAAHPVRPGTKRVVGNGQVSGIVGLRPWEWLAPPLDGEYRYRGLDIRDEGGSLLPEDLRVSEPFTLTSGQITDG